MITKMPANLLFQPVILVLLGVTLLGIAIFGCHNSTEIEPSAQRLVDSFTPAFIDEPYQETASPTSPTEWRFDGNATEAFSENLNATYGWGVVTGVSEFAVREGTLTGRSLSEIPIIRFSRTADLENDDLLHEIRVKMKVSAGERVSFHFAGSEENHYDRAIIAGDQQIWLTSTAVTPGEEMKEYSVQTPLTLRSSDIREIYFSPTDIANSNFAIDSIRLIFRREFLATKTSGISWEGLSNVYRETILARSPEEITWQVKLPANPSLDLALGTIEPYPTTFSVALAIGPDFEQSELLLERTVTTPNRWDAVKIDLQEFAGQDVALEMRLNAGNRGNIGLWGSPVIRNKVDSKSTSSRNVPQGVIFILIDTLRADHIQLYGYDRDTMPTIGRLAETGALFLDAQAQGTWTKVSTASLFTSLYPSTNGVEHFPDRLPSSATTLAEVFREAGYATLGFSSILFTGKFSNMHQGYEVLHENVGMKPVEASTRAHVDQLLPWLEEHRTDRFFVFLHVFDPHSPYEPNSPYNSIWADPGWHAEHRGNKDFLKAFIADPNRRVTKMPTRDEVIAAGMDPSEFIEREISWYDGSIRATDQEIQRLLERLEEIDLHEKTMIVVTSDHGEEFHDHGRMLHETNVYGELSHVPLLFWYPAAVARSLQVEETIELVDVMPTILDFSGLSKPKEMQGDSLRPLFAADSSQWRPKPAIIERPVEDFGAIPPLPAKGATALIFDGWKLIRNIDPAADTPEFELYDHRNDFLDQNDLASQHPEIVDSLSEMMAGWREKALSERLDTEIANPENLSPEELNRLRALGYVE